MNDDFEAGPLVDDKDREGDAEGSKEQPAGENADGAKPKKKVERFMHHVE